MEKVTARRWTLVSVIVALVVIVMMIITSLTPGITQAYGGSEVPDVSSPARNIAATQHTDVDLGEKVQQMYLISVLGILIIAIISFVILALMSLRERRKENI